MKPELVILIGNIGTGKSTTSKSYAEKGYKIICRDSMRSMLGAGKYIFNPKTEKVIHNATINILRELLLEQENIVVDETNVDKNTRKYTIKLGKLFGYKVIAHEMHKAVKNTCLKNRERDSLRGSSLEVWDSVWENFNRRYQKPEIDEGFDEIISEGDSK